MILVQHLVAVSPCLSVNSDLRARIDATIFAVSFSAVMYCHPSRANHLDQQSSFYGSVGHIVDSDDLLGGGGPATIFRRFSQRRESATTFRLLARDRLPRFINWFARSEYLKEVKAQKQKHSNVSGITGKSRLIK